MNNGPDDPRALRAGRRRPAGAGGAGAGHPGFGVWTGADGQGRAGVGDNPLTGHDAAGAPTTPPAPLPPAALFAALCDPCRLAVPVALVGGERTVTTLTGLTGRPQSTVSHHFARLAAAGGGAGARKYQERPTRPCR